MVQLGGSTQAQVAQRDCGVSVLGDTQTLTGQTLDQPALADPARARVGLDSLQQWLPASAVLIL